MNNITKTENKIIWREISEVQGMYEVSNLGDIRNTTNKKIRRLTISKKGYLTVSLKCSITNKIKTLRVHRLVMMAFKGDSNLDVHHINGIKTDNRLENLMYCTAKENNNYKKEVFPHRYTSNYKGVFISKGKIKASISINNMKYNLGIFTTEEEASLCYETVLDNYDKLGKTPVRSIRLNGALTIKTDSIGWKLFYKNKLIAKCNTEITIFEEVLRFLNNPSLFSSILI